MTGNTMGRLLAVFGALVFGVTTASAAPDWAAVGPSNSAKTDMTGGAGDQRPKAVSGHEAPESRLLVFCGGMEILWGDLHPGSDALDDTYEAYGYHDGVGTMTDMNLVAEVLLAPWPVFEVGGHFGYNNLIARGMKVDRPVRLSTEIGGVIRISPAYKEQVTTSIRLEAGVMLAQYVYRGVADQYSVGYVRPAVSLGSGVGFGGGELAIGWTYASAADGLAPGDALPFGGLDVTFMIRLAP